MCHRELRFYKSTACGHLTFTGDTTLDCFDPTCFFSSSHPIDCAERSPHGKCKCKRYFTQPDRIVTGEVDGFCPQRKHPPVAS